LEQKEELLNKKTKEIQELYEQTLETQRQQVAELERISGLSVDEAKEVLLKNVENEVKHEMAILIKDMRQRLKKRQRSGQRILLPWRFKMCG